MVDSEPDVHKHSIQSELKEKLKVEADLAQQATLQRQIEGREYRRGGTETSSSEGIPSDELV
ncbi:hypothetical protein PGT21_030379 [Puccinia graminis f. sp. tritici]|uniref:Uncharacterized protein n=1 Tax=Puccinia graminis f. sp. tritici TaxID=56615 RepID=A0A5B0NFN7_PUCGR|nr:hypothetical protein PGT21_030379 [Puccinia graminis f. sp. tritici]